MIRHSSSFFLSLIIHIALLLIIFYGYNQITYPKTVEEKKIKINLCCITEVKEPTLIEVQKPLKQEQEKIIQDQTPIQKETPKEVVVFEPKKTIPISKPLPPKKKIENNQVAKKPEMVKQEKVAPRESTIKEVSKENPQKTIIQEPIESISEKKARLEKVYVDEHLQKISELLSKNLYYPRSARKRNIQGDVVVRFLLSKNAAITNIEVVSSESEILSRAAVQTIKNLSGKLPLPPENLLLNVPISYRLSK